MIHILLLILKIIGITILAVLGLILLVLALVLFVPVFYRVRIIHNPQQTKVSAKVSFLWPVVSVAVQYLKKLSYTVRIFGIPILDSEKPKKEKVKKPKQHKPKKQKKVPAEKEDTPEDIFAPLENPGSLPKDEQEEPVQELLRQTKEEPKKEKKTGLFAKIKAKIQKLRETIRKIVAKIKKLAHQKDEVLRILGKTETKTAIKFAWGKLGRLLKHILPRKAKGYVAYGADNPATTGQVLGILSVVGNKTEFYGKTVGNRCAYQGKNSILYPFGNSN